MNVNGYWTVKETAKAWELSERRTLAILHTGRVEGAVRFGNAWAIPEGTPKPVDGRIKSGKYIKKKVQ